MLIRIVVDTNLFVSGTISSLGAPYLLVLAGDPRLGALRIVTAREFLGILPS